jgi:hypothetical protein
MPANERGSLRAAFSGFRQDADKEAELKLLGRTVDPPPPEAVAKQPASGPEPPQSYPVATGTGAQPAANPVGGLTPRPLLQREAVRQLSFRCPVQLASELRKKAAFNQLEQQQIIVEGIKRVLAELPDPPEGWQD